MKIEEISIATAALSANVNKVPAKAWKRWSTMARIVFNNVYMTMTMNQGVFLHPQAKRYVDEHWNTIAWNAAWTAADAVREVEAE